MSSSLRNTSRRSLTAAAALTVSAIALTGCTGSGFDSDPKSSAGSNGGLTVLIGSSGDAETNGINAAVADWSKASGTNATVTVANDLNQQLAQGFAAKKPADVFYLTPDVFAGYASNGSLLPYADKLENLNDFYPNLLDNYTYEGKVYCAPKDFSTLQLIINTDLWSAAGLTDADIPTTWDELSGVAAKLTTADHVGLAFSGEYARIGAFFAQAGGALMNADSTKATADSPENIAALTEVKAMLATGNVKYAADVDAGWGGEAFGKQKAAMTIEGNWITGALRNDFPEINYLVAELPAGPAGKGTLQFSSCWGIAADSTQQEAAIELVKSLTDPETLNTYPDAFGMPPLKTAAAAWSAANPDLVAFLNGATYAKSVPTALGSSAVVADLNAQLEQLSTGDPKTILTEAQRNLEALLK